MITCLIPLIELDGVLVGHLEGEPDQVGYLWPEDLVDAVDGNEVNGAFAAALVDSAVVGLGDVIVENEIVHFFFDKLLT